jgi:outer membrane protein assembly factor BamA
LEGTNSGGDLGLRGGLVFSNKNLFKGAEVLRLRFNGGIEAQHISKVAIGDNTSSSIFNTTELGVDANIYFPRFLSPVALRTFAKEYQPKTNVSIGFSDQKRTYYSRTILKAAFGYDWMTKPTIQHLFTPVNLSSVKVNPSPAFQEYLDEQSNQRFKDQYSDHLIFSAKYSFIFNNQNVNKLNDFIYYRANIESAGNILAIFNKTPLLDPVNDYHTLLGIRYSQYLKFDHDFRYYHLLTSEHRIIFRTMMGIGLPYGNSEEMPFEQSFYAGGANGMRGWKLRQLGPGSFSGSVDIERIGDVQLEFNVEYRFPVWEYLKGALFVDAGNIWTLQEKPYYTNGSFDVKTFYEELAIDAGIGFRFDFSFFIFRLDTAIPLRDPEYSKDQRWRFKTLQFNQLVWNFGIGYPF